MTSANHGQPLPTCDAVRGFTACSGESPLVADLLRPPMRLGTEMILLAGFDAFDRLIAWHCVQDHHARQCRLAPLDWRTLLAHRSLDQIVLAHSHPSGDHRPSPCDIRFTREIAHFLARAAINLSDHLILTAHGHFSFRRAGLL